MLLLYFVFSKYAFYKVVGYNISYDKNNLEMSIVPLWKTFNNVKKKQELASRRAAYFTIEFETKITKKQKHFNILCFKVSSFFLNTY